MKVLNPHLIRTSHASDRTWSLHHGDVVKVLPTLPMASCDGCLCDPPYGLGYMRAEWDRQVPAVQIWRGVMKACKPGAYLLAFGGTKTIHRLMANIEDAGWQLKDMLMWIHGEGVPKGINIGDAIFKRSSANAAGNEVGKHWDGYNTALKPAWEPIVLAQKPVDGTFASNAVERGCGGLNVDGCRIGSYDSVESINIGRWPANLILDEEAAHELDRQSGHTRSSRGIRRRSGSEIGNGKTMNSFQSRIDAIGGYEDAGGASRFFYVHKASKKERVDNGHPTVKPVRLCEYLARLILQPKRATPRRLLVPFSGSGSEMIGGLQAGWDQVSGIERDSEYVETARRRLAKCRS